MESQRTYLEPPRCVRNSPEELDLAIRSPLPDCSSHRTDITSLWKGYVCPSCGKANIPRQMDSWICDNSICSVSRSHTAIQAESSVSLLSVHRRIPPPNLTQGFASPTVGLDKKMASLPFPNQQYGLGVSMLTTSR